MESEIILFLQKQPHICCIGDDAAVLMPETMGQYGIIQTIDTLTEGVDFLLSETAPERIGRKALAVNLSDIAAMAAVPFAVLVSIVLPKQNNAVPLAKSLYNGMVPLLEKYNVKIIGGDTNSWDGGLVISITALGKITEHGVLRRSGGKAGDILLTTGQLGGSLLKHQFDFEPRVNEALFLNENYEIHAAIDISDGLSLDVFRMAKESGLGAVLEAEKIPVSDDAATMAKNDGKTPLQHALSDGEDFELLFSVSETEAARILSEQPLREKFGTMVERVGYMAEKTGLFLSQNGKLQPLAAQGFLH
ncbi:thiamine-monophosphate kinase [Planctomycetales bacterium]|nr:thiamine-monophosphate kinase [Planctomycetales bacterium]